MRADGRGRVGRVHAREDHVAGLGGRQRDLHGLRDRASRRRRSRRAPAARRPEARWRSPTASMPTLDLLDDRRPGGGARYSIGSSMVTMCALVAPVDLVDERRQRRRLSHAGGAADEHQASRNPRQRFDAQAAGSARPAAGAAWQHADGGGGASAFAVQVDAEPAAPRRGAARRRRGRSGRPAAACGGQGVEHGLHDFIATRAASSPSRGVTRPSTRVLGGAPATSSRSVAPSARTSSSHRSSWGEAGRCPRAESSAFNSSTAPSRSLVPGSIGPSRRVPRAAPAGSSARTARGGP